jgi:hypothetical protein
MCHWSPLIKSFCGGAMRKAQSAGRRANNTIDAVHHAPCAMRLPPLAAGGKKGENHGII